jgi:hypothetical protein
MARRVTALPIRQMIIDVVIIDVVIAKTQALYTFEHAKGQ